MKTVIISILLLFTFQASLYSQTNPPSDGFNLRESDAKAIAIADSVMIALGGRKNWDATRYITWKFFGRRFHVWDKWSGDYRLESKGLTVLMNLNSGEGRAWQGGEQVTDSDSLAAKLAMAKSIWINDSYWMFFPYKLKDSGVTLTYVGEGQTADNQPAHILQLTFAEVGDTPENKYYAYVDKGTYLLIQWDFFSKSNDQEARFSNLWKNWTPHGNILLSADRGRGQHSGIAVFEELPATVFSNPAPVDFESTGN